MNLLKLKNYYTENDLEGFEAAQDFITALHEEMASLGQSFEQVEAENFAKILNGKRMRDGMSRSQLIGLIRYLRVEKLNAIYLYLLTLTGGDGVMASIKSKLSNLENEHIAVKVIDDIPELGTPLETLSHYASEMMVKLKTFAPKSCHDVLADNHHQLPEATQLKEKELYEKAENFTCYLKDRHDRKIEELQQHCDDNRVWFEQTITQPVVDFVKSNQEVLSGVAKDNKLYITKIPYNTVAYLKAETQVQKRYHYCHCSFAKAAILDERIDLDPDWCYCSAGFAKFPFEVILGKKLKVQVLESVLKGDLKCRFQVELE